MAYLANNKVLRLDLAHVKTYQHLNLLIVIIELFLIY